MTEAEEKTFVRRQETFIKEGLDVVEAEDLAFSMMIRDREGLDDRRLCFECKHYQNKHCEAIRDSKGKPTQQLRFMLQRCPQFQLKGTK
jgi:hypothetical protein